MQCKCEFGPKDKLTTDSIGLGCLFRFYAGTYPFIRVAGGYCNLETGDSKPMSVSPNDPVVPIRIARLDYGVPVFVDA